jgi:hypothetical protein
MQRHAASATAYIEYPTPRVPHGLSLMRRPFLEAGKVAGSAYRNTKPAIIALDHLGRWKAPILRSWHGLSDRSRQREPSPPQCEQQRP